MNEIEKKYRQCEQCGEIATRRVIREGKIEGCLPLGNKDRHFLLQCKCGNEFHRYLLCGKCF